MSPTWSYQRLLFLSVCLVHVPAPVSWKQYQVHVYAVALEVALIAVLHVHLQSYDNMVLLLPVPLLDWSIVPSLWPDRPNAI